MRYFGECSVSFGCLRMDADAPGLQPLQRLKQLLDLVAVKHATWPLGVDIGER